jgi:NADPH-dependent 7-cyano-7-deazaguanine reductase QueF
MREGTGMLVAAGDARALRNEKIYHEQLCEKIWKDVKYVLGESVPVRVRLTSRYLGITVVVEKGEGTQP